MFASKLPARPTCCKSVLIQCFQVRMLHGAAEVVKFEMCGLLCGYSARCLGRAQQCSNAPHSQRPLRLLKCCECASTCNRRDAGCHHYSEASSCFAQLMHMHSITDDSSIYGTDQAVYTEVGLVCKRCTRRLGTGKQKARSCGTDRQTAQAAAQHLIAAMELAM